MGKAGFEGQGTHQQQHEKDVLQAIYDDITTTYGKFYLSGTEYDIIAGAVLREYPYIARAEGLQPADSKMLWHQRVREKFCNTHKRVDQNHPIVQSKFMRLQTTRGKDSQAASSKKNVWGVTNFLPAPEEEDDDISIKTFIEWMKKQSMLHSSKRDTAGIHLRMRKTFPERRDAVVNQENDIAVIKDTYPLLFNESEMISEFKRITIELLEEFQRGIDKYAAKLNRLPKSKGKRAGKELDLVKELRQELSAKSELYSYNYLQLCIVFLSGAIHAMQHLCSHYR